MPFAFETLTVYQLSLDWVTQATQIATALKRTDLAPLADQLVRASTSIPLNIAEGNGRWHKGDKKQFLWIARGSVFECVAITRATNQHKVISPEAHTKAYATLESLSKMLSRLIQAVDTMRADRSANAPRINQAPQRRAEALLERPSPMAQSAHASPPSPRPERAAGA